jgi:hypothetical protein
MSHKAKRVLETCQEAGYKVTLDYARQWVDHCPGDLHIASRAVMYDIELRKCLTSGERENQTDHETIGESVLKEGGRISLSVETAIAAGSLGRDERDAVLDYIEKDERLFKEFEKNVSSVTTCSAIVSSWNQMLTLVVCAGRAKRMGYEMRVCR